MSEKVREYDVAVIGAGNGGLVAAATAAKAGMKTLLVEQHNLPGGFASSFVRGRFEFEPSLHELCDIGPEMSGGCGTMFKNLGLDVKWHRVPEAYRMILTNEGEKLDVTMPFGRKEYVDAMEGYVSGSREVMEKFIALCDEIMDAIGYMAESKGHPDKKIMQEKYSNFLKTASYSIEEVENALKMPKAVKDILNAYWCYLGIPISRCNFTIFAAMFIKYIDLGAYIPDMRSHEISSSLDKIIRDFGGEIMYNTRVENIEVSEGRAISLTTDKGEKIVAKQFISNASHHKVYSSMITPMSAIPKLAFKSSNARRVGPAGYVLYLGLNKSPEELGFKDYSYFIYPTMDTEKLYSVMGSRDDNYIQATVCLNLANPDCSPKGTTIMSFTTLFTEGAWDDVTPENYYKEKNKIADKMINYFEDSTGIKIRDAIEEIEVATPITFANYTGAYNGSIYGYEPDSWD